MTVKVTNNAYGTLSAGINNSVTTVTLNSGEGARFPSLSAGEYFYATLIDTSNNLEVVKGTARSSDSLTVTRAQDNTTARAFSANDRCELRPTAKLFEDLQTEARDLNGTELILDADGDTSITADTDDRIDIKIAGSDVAGFDASGNFHLGNGTATNDGAIHINAGASAKNIVLEADRASDGQGLGNIQWHSAGTNVAQLSAERAASDSSADMVFYTYENSGSLTERARIDDKGDMFIGLSLDMGGKLNVHADGVAVGEGTSANEYRRMYWHASNNQLQFWNGTNECVINSSGAFTDASDKKLKKDIADITYGIDIVKALKPRKYKMKDTNEEQVGFIAQEVEPHIPEVVTTGTNPDGVEQKSLAYQHLTAVLTKALQEAVAKIETLETKVAALESK